MTASSTATRIGGFDPKAMAAAMSAVAGAATQPAGVTTEKASIYLAIGYVREGVDLSALDPKTDIINLPQLIGLDNMKPDTRRAGTQAFADEQAEKNDLLSDLVEESLKTLEPGEIRVLGCDQDSGLIVTIYRKKDEVVAAVPAKRAKRTFL